MPPSVKLLIICSQFSFLYGCAFFTVVDIQGEGNLAYRKFSLVQFGRSSADGKIWMNQDPAKGNETDEGPIFHPDRVFLPPLPSADGFPVLNPVPAPILEPVALPMDELVRPIAGPDPIGVPIYDLEPARSQSSCINTPIVYFGYDSSFLDERSQLDLQIFAQVLSELLYENSAIEVQIDGHTDERGTLEYNLLLGNSRAWQVKSFLVDTGVRADRLHTTSYGEERPVDTSPTEEAFQRNRRVQFVIYE